MSGAATSPPPKWPPPPPTTPSPSPGSSPSIVQPKHGGVITKGGFPICWTGGQPSANYKSLADTNAKPKTFQCYRLTDQSAMMKSYTARTTVPSSFVKLEKNAKAEQFRSYVSALEQRFIEHGTDTTLYVVDPSMDTTTTSILKTYSRLTKDHVDQEVAKFKKEWDEFTSDNDQCNRQVIYSTIGPKLHDELLLRDKNHDLPSASLFMLIASSATSITTAEIERLCTELHGLKLDSFAGQNVSAFVIKALDLHRKLVVAESFKQSSQQLVFQNLAQCSVERFRQDVYKLEAAIEKPVEITRQFRVKQQEEYFVERGIDFEKNLTKLEETYNKLVTNNQWPPKGNKIDTQGAPDINFANCTKAEANAAIKKMVDAGVKAEIAKLKKDEDNTGNGNNNDAKKDQVKCGNCGHQHGRGQKCPFKNSPKVDKLSKPGEKDPKIVL